MNQKLQEFLDVLMGFRKFIAFLMLFSIAVIFRVESLVDGSQFVDLMKNVCISFFAVNGVEHFTLMARDFIASKSGPKPEDPQ